MSTFHRLSPIFKCLKVHEIVVIIITISIIIIIKIKQWPALANFLQEKTPCNGVLEKEKLQVRFSSNDIDADAGDAAKRIKYLYAAIILSR